MNDRTPPALNKWPFLIADLLLVGVAAFIVQQNPRPLAFPQTLLCVGLVALGAFFSILPFLLEYRAAVRLAEGDHLNETVAQIQNLEAVASHIKDATAQWQDIQAAAGNTARAAGEIAERMGVEVREFTEFLKKANDSEKAALRLEVEKLRRAEGDWLQILVRILDHVFALYQAAARSGQPELVQQLGHFQNACRDVARRIGLLPFAADADEVFDANRHKLPDSQTAPEGARVAETLATGFTFQGRLLRPALVKLKPAGGTADAPSEPAAETSPREPTLL
jgi:molecular chaperone GrpE (heat shock protein)